MIVYNLSTDSNQHDQTVCGNYAFPIDVFTTVLDKTLLGLIEWHWHEELQLSLVTGGTIAFYVNDEKLVASAGEGVFINSKELHMVHPELPGSSYIGVNFAGRLIYGFEHSQMAINNYLPYVTHGQTPALLLSPDNEWQREVLALIPKIIDIFSVQDFGWELDVCTNLAHAWKGLICNGLQKSTDSADLTAQQVNNNRIKLILQYIQDNYDSRISLLKIADIVHLCSNECCRFFKRYMGRTIFEYITDYRLSKSMELLCTTDLSVSDIAFKCGFGSTSYFIDKFHKKTGHTPHSYRKTSTENINGDFLVIR